MKYGLMVVALLSSAAGAFAQFGPPGGFGPPRPAKATAPEDLTGYWVSLVTEDWRWRMVTPAKGDYDGVPLNGAGRKVADGWDPAKDEADGKPVQGLRSAGDYTRARAFPHYLAGRQHAETGNGRGDADALIPFRREASGQRAMPVGRDIRWRRGITSRAVDLALPVREVR